MPPTCRRILATASLAALLVLPHSAAAQPLTDLLAQVRGGSVPADILDPETEERAIDTATRAFGHAATRRVDALLERHPKAAKGTEERLRELAARATRRFAAEVREELIDAKGDGLLTQQELGEEIAEARDASLDALREALRAALDGAEPPPDPLRVPSTSAYVVELARYTLVERNPPRQWLILLAWILGAVLVARGAAYASRHLLGDRAPSKARVGRSIAAVRGPLYLLAGAIGLSAGRSWIWLPVGAEELLRDGVELLAGLSLLWLVWRISVPLGRGLAGIVFGEAGRARDEVSDVARKGIRLAAIALFSLLIAQILFDAKLTTLLAGIGILGVAASVAAQDTLRNVVASATIHGDRPFAAGDLVRFRDYLGRVGEVGFRSTRLRTLDGPVVVMPNAEIVRECVENLSARRHIRHHYAVDLVFGTPPERMREAVQILEEILEEREFPEGYEPHVAFDAFGPHSLRIEVWYTSDTGDYFEAKKERTEVNLEILRRFGEAGLEFAFPTRTLHLETQDAHDEPAG